MFKLKKEKEARKDTIVDMNESLIQYGSQKLPQETHVVQKIYDTAKAGLENLDVLFNDNGFGRTENFLDVAKGFLVDFYDLDPKETDTKAAALAQEAIDYLGKNMNDFIKWER
ncbi:hypothetical protein FC83_GL002369 [Agrilactobacillus composti DSM 18527 = JCM 14202]|uniref:Uncharacterized protein n=1 Tax=Agrilactobacillus composti DSM 18527 = JCM 14202 TaxID=1423734 RepID=A0A0R1Y395_9LACO|nr:hypothetical protein FC83_GL002369 [Agrilactobacillus composti DSM 18527 = JCM 14202]